MRHSEYSLLDPMFLQRWSPRAYDSTPLAPDVIQTLFEASRWSPSCFNEQPWRFVYASEPDELTAFQEVLADANRGWATKAPLLAITFAKNTFSRNGQPNRWAQFDSGAAWMALALQAHKLGLAAHAMGGFDAEKACQVANIDPNEFTAMCVIAVGKQADPQTLPEPLREREAPSDRKPLTHITFKGRHTA